ncbi:MAG: hypothetical protein A2Y33_15000 [Spirochaetes bacterium GWF1_51_8]|nr:MAG: hypothetical protein A2Y33_15000 [Spirochaetes bacterium GWF1_51_8]
MKKILIILSVLFVFIAGAAYSAPLTVKTMIGGFVNLGDKKQDNIGELTARSLYNLFAKMPGSDLVDIQESLDTVKQKGILSITNGKELNLAMTKVAQQTGAGLIIFGVYKVAENKLSLYVFGIDVVTGDLKFSREFSGAAGMDVFDTIDRLTEEIAGVVLGKKIEFGNLTVNIKAESAEYRVYLNGKLIGKADSLKPFAEKVLAGEENELTIVNSKTMKEVFRDIFTVKKGETKTVDYTPAGKITVTVLNVTDPVILKWDGNKVWDVIQGEPFQMRNIDISKPHQLEIVDAKGEVKNGTKITLEEGESAVMNIDLSKGDRKFGMALKALEGGMSFSLGVDYSFTPMMKLGFYFGIMFYETSTIINGVPNSAMNNLLKFDLEYCLYFLKLESFPFALGGTVFGTGFLTTGSSALFTLSPGLGVKVNISQFFVDIKARYSFVDNNIHPMLGIGLALDF